MPIRLSILGIGIDLPPSADVADHVRSRGGDATTYVGWKRAGHAGADDHPSTMGRRALSEALGAANLAADELDLVVFTGTSRDYPASWSVSMEIIDRCKIGPSAVGIDVMAGCLSTLTSFDLTHGWLAQRGGGHAAIVAAERWTSTIDFAAPSLKALWGYGDGAAAAVVGLNSSRPSLLDVVGSEYRNASSNNGYVRMAYGGTRAPIAPPNANPNTRVLADKPREFILDLYRKGYEDAIAALAKRFDFAATHLVCNQTSPGMVAMVADAAGLQDHVTVTGHRTGHLGGADLLVGLDDLIRSGRNHDTILVGASAAYGFGAALMVKPGTYQNVGPSFVNRPLISGIRGGQIEPECGN